MNFLITSPNFPSNLQYFALRLKEEGVNVLGIGDTPYEELSDNLKYALTEYYKVENMENLEEVKRGVAFLIFKHGPIDRIESNTEHWLVNDAELREQFNVTGPKLKDLTKTMYKSRMKSIFKKAGLPVVEGYLVEDEKDFKKALKTLKYPFIAKPDHGVGTSATYKIENKKDADFFLENWDGVNYFLEPFVDNAELCTYDGLLDADGNIVYETSFYYNTTTLEHTNGADYSYVVESKMDPKLQKYGRDIVKAFGMKERFFHIEFFRKKNGEYVVIEYNNRSSGGHSIDLYNHSISGDLYKVYAQIVTGKLEEKPVFKSKYASSVSRRDGVEYVHSHEEIYAKYGDCIKMSMKLPKIFSDIMGDEAFIAISDTRKKADELVEFIHKRK
ncbi:ATP-grasp domain-containing protein [Gemella sp. 19428wG2_WT2a]|nr:ATP-grasp domain-containing protein [Gemella sp. 19428wG2_WT2a]TFU58854.1 ATP-grasp domain-containing protein [Gemella sp. WT2a]